MTLGLVTKEPAEVFPVTVDFKNELAAGETISAAAVTSTNRATGADTTGTIVTGAAGINGSQVSQRVQAGASGEVHILQFRITTSASNVFEAEVGLSVQEE
jgi:hypothetical protein